MQDAVPLNRYVSTLLPSTGFLRLFPTIVLRLPSTLLPLISTSPRLCVSFPPSVPLSLCASV